MDGRGQLMKNFNRTVILILTVLVLYAVAQHTSASIDNVHTWTAIQHFAASTDLVSSPSAADRTTKIASTGFVVPGVTTSTSGPVSDPGDTFDYQYNNAAGALTFNAPDGVVGLERCYRNATGKSGVITVQMASLNTVDLNGANGSTAGTLVSTGALADGICINSDATHHWYAAITSGSWTNN